MATWYYARGGERRGPVDLEKLVAAARAGKLRPDDLVWNDGMPDWVPAGTVPEMGFGMTPVATPELLTVSELALAATPVAIPPRAEVAYYSDRGGIPERAAAALKGYALPTGDVGVWPIGDNEVTQWVEACKQRRLIRSAYGLFRGLCALNIIFAVIVVLVAIGTLTSGRNGTATAFGSVIAVIFVGGIAVVLGLAATATRKNQAWGAIAITVLVALATVLQLVTMVFTIASNNGRDVAATAITTIVSLAINAAFLVVSARAIPAVKKFRACPAWCQELLIVGKF